MLAKQLGLDDTCGVHNLHGLPGIIGAIGGAVSAASASTTMYGESISTVFPRRGAPDNLTAQSAGRCANGRLRHHPTVLLVRWGNHWDDY